MTTEKSPTTLNGIWMKYMSNNQCTGRRPTRTDTTMYKTTKLNYMDVYVIMIAYTAAGDERDHCFIMIIEENTTKREPRTVGLSRI